MRRGRSRLFRAYAAETLCSASREDGTLVLCCGEHIGVRQREYLAESAIIHDSQATLLVVNGLCYRPDKAGTITKSRHPEAVIVLGCTMECASAALEEIRQAGIDSARSTMGSLGSALGAFNNPVDHENDSLHLLEATIAGAATRAGGLVNMPYAGVERRPVGNSFDRRSLLQPWRSRARTSAVLDGSLCYGAERCGVCMAVCPASALKVVDKELRVSAADCTACGICSVICPAGAISVPGSPPLAIADQINTVVQKKVYSLILGCEHDRANSDFDASRNVHLPSAIVSLPCTAMIGPGLLLGLAVAGIKVCVSSCSTCINKERLNSTMAIVWHIISVLGAEEMMVTIESFVSSRHHSGGADPVCAVTQGPDHLNSKEREQISLNEPRATGTAVREIYTQFGNASSIVKVIPEGSAYFGVVRIDDTVCTGCGACVLACPTEAIRQNGVGKGITLDATGCNGCFRCVAVCPENAISATWGIDLPMMLAGPVVHECTAGLSTCQSCGSPLEPDPIREAVVRRLASSDANGILLASLGHCKTCNIRAKRLIGYPGSE